MTKERHDKITRKAIRFTSLAAARSYANGAHVPLTVVQHDYPHYLVLHPQYADELVNEGGYDWPPRD